MDNILTLAIANQWGSFDMAHDRLPGRYQHIEGQRLQPICRKLGVKFCDAVVDFEESYGNYPAKPIKNGVIVTKTSAPKLLVAIEHREARSAKRRAKEAVKSERLKQEETIRNKQRDAAIDWLADNVTGDVALESACSALFHLNRYVKRSENNIDFRTQVYGLKNRLIDHLYGAGFCDRVELHTDTKAVQVCYGCDGGRRCDGDICERCDGTGIWQDSIVLVFVVFSFVVVGTRYTWHQPEGLINFKYEIRSGDATEFQFEHRSKAQPVCFDPLTALDTLAICVEELHSTKVAKVVT
ncbi:MAG: hypothetical protein ABGZ35_22975 [Planctomycetaceae bacterium]